MSQGCGASVRWVLDDEEMEGRVFLSAEPRGRVYVRVVCMSQSVLPSFTIRLADAWHALYSPGNRAPTIYSRSIARLFRLGEALDFAGLFRAWPPPYRFRVTRWMK